VIGAIFNAYTHDQMLSWMLRSKIIPIDDETIHLIFHPAVNPPTDAYGWHGEY
jgi:hypothetical protein